MHISRAMKTKVFDKLVELKGVYVPDGEPFRDFIVTGPPGSGKTTLLEALGGWPEEGYLDIAEKNWWRSRLLTFRPREVHLGIPFWDHENSHSVSDREWLACNRLTPADLACYPYTALAYQGGFSLNDYPSLRAWIARVEASPGYVAMPGLPAPSKDLPRHAPINPT